MCNLIEKPIRKVFTMKSYLDNIKEEDGDIRSDQDVQRLAGQWNKNMTNELVFTVLTDDYVPPIILGEDVGFQKWIIDGLQRSTSFKIFRFGNYKITSAIKNPVVCYREKATDENGNIIWEYKECNIKGKTYEMLPKELQKKFDEYQVETVIHEKCSAERLSELVRRYNNHKAMNAAQKAFTAIGKFARKIRSIIENRFFVECGEFTENEKTNGTIERTIMETIMCMFHLDSWKKSSERTAEFLNEVSNDSEFETLDNHLHRLQKIITQDLRSIFNAKDAFIWFTLFYYFTKYDLPDKQFAYFLREFKENLHSKEIDGKVFDEIDKNKNTKDKSVIIGKLKFLETLMREYLHIDIVETQLDNVNILKFVRENVKKDVALDDIELDDIEFDRDMLNDWMIGIPKDSPIYTIENNPSLLSIVRYAITKEYDDELMENWFTNYESRNNSYTLDQKENYICMRKDLEKYVADYSDYSARFASIYCE